MPSEDYPPSSDDEESDFRGVGGHPASGNVHFMPPRFDEILEINVESLLGTTFELRLSASTTIGRIKSRLQGSEGIAKQHLHLLHRGVELQDDLTLLDCGITNGSTLKLVLSMRGGPINTRRVAMPPPKQQQQPNHAELHSLMMRNKAQILDKIPKNGQVTVLLFREGDKVNLYHVQEKADGSFTPLSASESSGGNEPNWSGRSSSLRNLLSKDPRANPELEQRLKENAVTMNKMMELRTQLENLSMTKKKRKQSTKVKRVGSGSMSALGARPRSKGTKRQTTSSSATAATAGTFNPNRTRTHEKSLAGLARKNTKGLSGSLSGAPPLPPINQSSMGYDTSGGFTNDRLRDIDYDEEFCTILPLPPKTGRLSRQSSLSSTLPSVAGLDLSETMLQRKSKKSKSKNRNKTTQSRISEESATSRVPQWLERNDLHQPRPSQFNNNNVDKNSKELFDKTPRPNMFDDDDDDEEDYLATDFRDGDIESVEEDDPHPSAQQQQRHRPRNIDLIDLQFRPNEDDSLRIVNCRKTQKLISADIRSLVQGGNSPVRGQHKKRKPSSSGRPKDEGSYSGRFKRNVATGVSSSEASPTARNKRDNSQFDVSPLGTPQGRMLALRSSSSRMSSSKRRQLPTSSHSRRTTSSRSQTSAKRPTFVANTLATAATASTGSAARRKKKSSSSKPRCAMSECKKKLNLTNTFSCRCELNFCPTHRHPEWHNCTFDYKTEGRRLLEKANPIVTVPKLPKI